MWILLGIIDDSSLGNIDIEAALIFMRWYGQSLCARQLEGFSQHVAPVWWMKARTHLLNAYHCWFETNWKGPITKLMRDRGTCTFKRKHQLRFDSSICSGEPRESWQITKNNIARLGNLHIQKENNCWEFDFSVCSGKPTEIINFNSARGRATFETSPSAHIFTVAIDWTGALV